MVSSPSFNTEKSSETARIQGLQVHYCQTSTTSVVKPCSHGFYEICYILDDHAESYVIGEKRYSIKSGDVLLIPPGMAHYPAFDTGREEIHHRYELWVDMEQLKRDKSLKLDLLAVFQTCERASLYRIQNTSPPSWNQMENYLHAMWREVNCSVPCKHTYLASLCTHFIVQLNRMIAREHMTAYSRSASDHLFEMVISHIQQNYSKPLTLQIVADRFFTTPSNIEMLFSKKAHCPFYRYVTECRIIQAQNLIAMGIPMKEICTICGYNDYSNFYRAFTKVTGMTPSKFGQRLYHECAPKNAWHSLGISTDIPSYLSVNYGNDPGDRRACGH